MKVLGIDPGTTKIGYGAIEKKSNNYTHIKSGTIEVSSEETGNRLIKIDKRIKEVIKEVEPEKAGIEKVFFSKNKSSAMKVAQARGVVLLSLAQKDIPFFEISPSEAKVSVTGNGNASKDAVAKMVGHFLNKDTEELGPDTTDALAIAIASSTK